LLAARVFWLSSFAERVPSERFFARWVEGGGSILSLSPLQFLLRLLLPLLFLLSSRRDLLLLLSFALAPERKGTPF
jgi:hypothetical protein